MFYVVALYGGVELRDRRGVTASSSTSSTSLPSLQRDVQQHSPLMHAKLSSLQFASSGSEESVSSLDKNNVSSDVVFGLRLGSLQYTYSVCFNTFF